MTGKDSGWRRFNAHVMSAEINSVGGWESGGKIAGLGAGVMVTGVAREHGGTVGVKGEPGRGAEFRGRPSLAADGVTPAPTGAPARMERGGGEAILLVDDEKMVLQMAAMALRAYGHEVIEAENGEAALALWAKEGCRVRLLLTDMVMPGMTGQELARRLLAEKPELRVIYSSGNCDSRLMRELHLEEGRNFVGKPYSIGALAGAVRRALDG